MKSKIIQHIWLFEALVISYSLFLFSCQDLSSNPIPSPTTTASQTTMSTQFALGLVFPDAAKLALIPINQTPIPIRGVPISLGSGYDLTSKLPIPGDQGNSNSCAAWAVSYGLKSYQEFVEHNWSLTDNAHLFSPNWIYNFGETGGMPCTGGRYIYLIFGYIQDNGAATYSTYQLSRGYCQNDTNPQSAINESVRYKIGPYAQVQRNIDTLKNAIKTHGPLVCGMDIFPQFFYLDPNNTIYNSLNGTSYGGHAIVLIGWDDTLGRRGAFKILNSWGTSWGAGGYAYIDFDLIENHIDDFYFEAYWAPDLPGSSTGLGILSVKTAPVVGVISINGVEESRGSSNKIVPVGTYAISYSDETVYNKPTIQNVVVISAQITETVGVYTHDGGNFDLQGTWILQSINGTNIDLPNQTILLSGNDFTISYSIGSLIYILQGKISITVVGDLKYIDIQSTTSTLNGIDILPGLISTARGDTAQGIYKIEGDRLTVKQPDNAIYGRANNFTVQPHYVLSEYQKQ